MLTQVLGPRVVSGPPGMYTSQCGWEEWIGRNLVGGQTGLHRFLVANVVGIRRLGMSRHVLPAEARAELVDECGLDGIVLPSARIVLPKSTLKFDPNPTAS